ncbi:hypothetical protein E5288_WYG001758 [Bos mutus]|uniref:Uncharacterized protein n=1 Tax=Bos mutus TaxID=72004 RepID=A0A6B0RUA9_9CETA|nr:hypothetical protein [Bos mutus]
MPLLPALQVLTRKPRHRGRHLQPQQTPVADPTRLIERYCQETDEDKATGHKAQSPVTPRTKGNMTAWVVTEIAHGIHLLPVRWIDSDWSFPPEITGNCCQVSQGNGIGEKAGYKLEDWQRKL